MPYATMIGIGLAAGVCAGLFGVGGGLVIVPLLVLLAKLDLHTAIGTSLGALLLPVGLLGVLQFHRAGHLNIRYSLLIALGLFIGTYFGARLVLPLPPPLLRKVYAGFLAVVALKMIIGR